jgi:hypothetical protein
MQNGGQDLELSRTPINIVVAHLSKNVAPKYSNSGLGPSAAAERDPTQSELIT